MFRWLYGGRAPGRCVMSMTKSPRSIQLGLLDQWPAMGGYGNPPPSNFRIILAVLPTTHHLPPPPRAIVPYAVAAKSNYVTITPDFHDLRSSVTGLNHSAPLHHRNPLRAG